MATFRQILARLVLILSICLFFLASCNSTRYTTSTHVRQNRSYSKINEKHFRTIPQQKVKAGSVKCHHVKATIIDQENQIIGISENTGDRTDFTLIILSEPIKPYLTVTEPNKVRTDKILPKVRQAMVELRTINLDLLFSFISCFFSAAMLRLLLSQ